MSISWAIVLYLSCKIMEISSSSIWVQFNLHTHIQTIILLEFFSYSHLIFFPPNSSEFILSHSHSINRENIKYFLIFTIELIIFQIYSKNIFENRICSCTNEKHIGGDFSSANKKKNHYDTYIILLIIMTHTPCMLARFLRLIWTYQAMGHPSKRCNKR